MGELVQREILRRQNLLASIANSEVLVHARLVRFGYVHDQKLRLLVDVRQEHEELRENLVEAALAEHGHAFGEVDVGGDGVPPEVARHGLELAEGG